MASTAKAFRESFKISKDKLNWYPGHMKHSFTHMQAKMRKVDCVVEVHDSRIPFSGRNPKFLFNLIGSKPHILVLNKKDLVDKSNLKLIEKKCYEENCGKVIFTSCLKMDCDGLNKIIPSTIDLIRKERIYPSENLGYKIMVVGVPNVGKSSFINALRNINFAKGKATPVGAIAGVTKKVLNEIRICSNPPIYLIDTPGILVPNISDTECGMKLALCACLNDSVVGVNYIADFLLYWMNKTENFIYVDYFGLSRPVDDIFSLLLKIAVDNNFMKRVKNVAKNCIEEIPNVDSAAEMMVKLFRKGNFGDLGLDRNYYARGFF